MIGVRFGKFNLVGLMGAAVQVLLLDLLVKQFRLSPAAAMPAAVEMAVLHNFLWHERFTWRDREPAGLRQRAIRLGRFHAANGLVSLGGNTLILYLLVEVLGAPALPSALAAIALCSPLNYLVADRWVYGQSGDYKIQREMT